MVYSNVFDCQYQLDAMESNSYLQYELGQIKVQFTSGGQTVAERYFQLIGKKSLDKITIVKSEPHYGFVMHIVVYNRQMFFLLVENNTDKRINVFKSSLVRSELERTNYNIRFTEILSKVDPFLKHKRALQLVMAEFDFVKTVSHIQAIPDTLYQVAEILEILKLKL